MIRRRIYGLILSVLLLAGCAGPRRAVAPVEPLPAYSAEALMEALRNQTPPVPLRARIRLRMITPDRRVSLGGILQYTRDSLYASLSPGLGIQAAQLLITQDSLYLLNRMENVLYVASLEELAPHTYPLTLPRLLRLLAGMPDLPVDRTWQLVPLDDAYLLTSRDSLFTVEIDPHLLRVRTLVVRNEMREDLLVGHYTYRDGILPEALTLILPRQEQQVQIRTSAAKQEPPYFGPLRTRTDTRRIPLAVLLQTNAGVQP